MNTNINMELEFGVYHGSMIVDIYENDRFLLRVDNSTTVNTSIKLPCDLNFVLSNKNQKLDTLVDETGNVIADKYVVLKKLSAGFVPVADNVLFKTCRLITTDNQEIYNTFWGFNGTATIEFHEDDILRWHLKQDNRFDL